MNLNIIGKRNIFLIISAILILASTALIVSYKIKPGIDFVGGSSWQIKIKNEKVNENNLKEFLSKLGIKNFVAYPALGTQSYLIRLENISEPDHQKYFEALKNEFGDIEELSFESIGPAIGHELAKKAIWASILVLLGICFYVTFAFRRTSYLVPSFRYGIITLVCLVHDVIIPLGVLVYLGHARGIDFNISFVVALLTIMGYSVHDTIVVFDRIRSNLLTHRGELNFPQLTNNSVNQIITRSINTSLTTLFALLALLFLGPFSLRYFILVLSIGVAVGTYSSIFVAAPLLVIWQNKSNRKYTNLK